MLIFPCAIFLMGLVGVIISIVRRLRSPLAANNGAVATVPTVYTSSYPTDNTTASPYYPSTNQEIAPPPAYSTVAYSQNTRRLIP